MICDICFKKITSWRWYNNQKVCDTCHHSKMPKHVKYPPDIKPTWENLKKLWEKKS